MTSEFIKKVSSNKMNNIYNKHNKFKTTIMMKTKTTTPPKEPFVYQGILDQFEEYLDQTPVEEITEELLLRREISKRYTLANNDLERIEKNVRDEITAYKSQGKTIDEILVLFSDQTGQT